MGRKKKASNKPAQANVSIGDDIAKHLYSDCKITIEESQSMYVLQHDTIKAFMQEKAGVIAAESRFFAYIGIAISIGSSLATASFQDTFGIKGAVIQGTFIAFLVISLIMAAREGWTWFSERKHMSPESLTRALGAKGAKITPNSKSTTAHTQAAMPVPAAHVTMPAPTATPAAAVV